LGEEIQVVSVSDTTGTAVTEGMAINKIISAKEGGLKTLPSFQKMTSLEAIRNVESDLVVEITQSTRDGRPGTDHALEAFSAGKDLVTANKSIMISDIDIIGKAKESGD